jgi:hypothetical protein
LEPSDESVWTSCCFGRQRIWKQNLLRSGTITTGIELMLASREKRRSKLRDLEVRTSNHIVGSHIVIGFRSDPSSPKRRRSSASFEASCSGYERCWMLQLPQIPKCRQNGITRDCTAALALLTSVRFPRFRRRQEDGFHPRRAKWICRARRHSPPLRPSRSCGYATRAIRPP